MQFQKLDNCCSTVHLNNVSSNIFKYSKEGLNTYFENQTEYKVKHIVFFTDWTRPLRRALRKLGFRKKGYYTRQLDGEHTKKIYIMSLQIRP